MPCEGVSLMRLLRTAHPPAYTQEALKCGVMPSTMLMLPSI